MALTPNQKNYLKELGVPENRIRLIEQQPGLYYSTIRSFQKNSQRKIKKGPGIVKEVTTNIRTNPEPAIIEKLNQNRQNFWEKVKTKIKSPEAKMMMRTYGIPAGIIFGLAPLSLGGALRLTNPPKWERQMMIRRSNIMGKALLFGGLPAYLIWKYRDRFGI